MKILITGGLGQIGSHVAEMFLARGDEVCVIDNLATGRKEHLKDNPNLRVEIASIADNDLFMVSSKILGPIVWYMPQHLTKTQMIGIMTH